ncbi:MAG TPA: hypothetical protein VGO00_22745, partial [Kofleriaceae bacterium]|nr:hypothetical protein [Kofleriaceae bacterium]
MRGRRAYSLLFVAGCSFHSAAAPAGEADAPIADAAVISDAPPDVTLQGVVKCYGNGFGVSVCITEPTAPLMLDANTEINTDTSSLCIPANPTTFCVLAGTAVQVSATIGATGKRPLVLLATATDLHVAATGSIDVASHRNRDDQHTGGGADGTPCTTGMPPDDTDGHGGGGEGGSFGGGGGNGGIGYNGGQGGIAGGAATIDLFRGGCPGFHGAGGDNSGGAGHGGGAVYLYAEHMVMVDGTINASGESGGGADTGSDGGGGGGSGGMIVFDAEMLHL